MASIQTWMNRFKVAHGEVYDYSKFTTTKSTELRTIICRIHGEFQQNPYNHAKGHGCDQCAKIVRGGKKRKSHDEFISEVSKLYGDLVSFEKTQYVTSQTPIMVTCKKHGDFITSPHNFRRGKLGCHLCAGDNRGKYPTQQLESQKTAKLRIERSRQSIIDKARKVHGNRYEYDLESYTSARVPFTVICKEHGPFQVRLGHHLKRGHGCSICANSTSAGEYAIGEFIESLDIPLEKRNRTVLSGREIDIYLPDQKLGIEFNGAYWHTDDKLHKLSLKDKWQLCLDKGIRLIHIFEDEWKNKPHIIQDLIRASLGKRPTLQARRLSVGIPTISETTKFLNQWHIQGSTGSSIKLGLYLEDQLVSVITLGKPRFGSEDWEIIRYASSHHIPGGFEKLMKHFPPGSMVTYADLRFGSGGTYSRAGFEFVDITTPDYWWIKGSKRLPRYQTQKHKLESHEIFGPYYSKNLTEKQICEAAGFQKLTGVGHAKYVKL